MATTPIELIAEDWMSTGTLVVEYSDSASGGRRQCWADTGVRVRCNLPASAYDVQVYFEEPFFGGRLVAVDRDDPALPWRVDEDGDYCVESFEYPVPPVYARFYLKGSAITGSHISRVEVQERQGCPDVQRAIASVRFLPAVNAGLPSVLESRALGGRRPSRAASSSSLAPPEDDEEEDHAPRRAVNRVLRRVGTLSSIAAASDEVGRKAPSAAVAAVNSLRRGATVDAGARQDLRRSSSTTVGAVAALHANRAPRRHATTHVAGSSAGVERESSDPPHVAGSGLGVARASSLPGPQPEGAGSDRTPPPISPEVAGTPQEIARVMSAQFGAFDGLPRHGSMLSTRRGSSVGERFGWRRQRSWRQNPFAKSHSGDSRRPRNPYSGANNARNSDESDSGDADSDSSTTSDESTSSSSSDRGGKPAPDDGGRRPWLWRRRKVKDDDACSDSSDDDEEFDKISPKSLTYEEHDRRSKPTAVERRRTDVMWIFGFVIAIGFYIYVAWWACHCPGNTLSDFDGNLCNDGYNTGKPYLFFCRVGEDAEQPDTPICVSECPTSNLTTNECPVNKTSWRTIPDYPTVAEKGLFTKSMLCEPVDGRVKGSPSLVVLNVAIAIGRHWEKIVSCMVFGLVVAVAYVRMLRTHAGTLVWGSILILEVALVVWAIVLGFREDNKVSAIIVGIGAVLLACMADSQRDLINKTTTLIQLACKCVLELPVLKACPVFVSLLRICSLLIGYALVRRVIFCSWGAGQEHHLQRGERAFIIYIVFMFMWQNFVLSAGWSFIITYTTTMWYFTGGKKKSSCLGSPAFRALFCHHLGSVILGGLVCGFVTPLRVLVALLTAPLRAGVECCSSCFCCCCSPPPSPRHASPPSPRTSSSFCGSLIDFYEEHLEPLTHRAFVDISLNSSPFFRAARWSKVVSWSSDRQLVTVRAVNCACSIFQILGVSVIFILTRMLAAMLFISQCSGAAEKCDSDLADVFDAFHALTSRHTIAANITELVASGTAILTAIVALPFMNLFGRVSDTLLYCAAVQGLREAADEAAHGKAEVTPEATPFYNRMSRSIGQGFTGFFGYMFEAIQQGCGGWRPGHDDPRATDETLESGVSLDGAEDAESERSFHTVGPPDEDAALGRRPTLRTQASSRKPTLELPLESVPARRAALMRLAAERSR